jgi:predicted small secreted protein
MAMLAYLVGVGLICGIYIFLYNKIRSFREKKREGK